MTQAGDRPNNA